MRIALLLLVACGSSAVPPPPPPLRPDPEPRPVEPVAPAPDTTPPTPPEPERRTLQSFPGIDLLESRNFEMHEHGGDAAKLSTLHLELSVLDRRAHHIEARSVELLRRHCREDNWHSRKKLALKGYMASWAIAGDSKRGEAIGKTELVLPAGEPRRVVATIMFQTVEVYQACDVFAFSVDIVVDRVRHVFEIPLDVTRVEPID